MQQFLYIYKILYVFGIIKSSIWMHRYFPIGLQYKKIIVFLYFLLDKIK